MVPIGKVGSAVARNYARRRLREFYRCNRELFPEKTEILVKLKKAPESWNNLFGQIKEILEQISRDGRGDGP